MTEENAVSSGDEVGQTEGGSAGGAGSDAPADEHGQSGPVAHRSGGTPLRVCHLVGQLGRGGRESLLLDAVENTGPGVVFHVCSMGAADPIAAAFERAGATVFDAGADSRADLAALVRVFRFLRAGEFDVVHAHGPTSQIPGRVLGRLARAGSVVSTHHIVRNEHDAWLNWLERLTRPLDTATVAVSEDVRESYAVDGWQIVRNGIDVDSFRSTLEAVAETALPDHAPAADPTFLNVGRYTPQKAQADLVDAMPTVLDSHPEAHLFIVGGRGELGDDLRAGARDHGIADHVTVTGPVSNVAPYYDRADAFVSASRSEGLPIVLLEAMAAGLPVVATAVPGNRQAVVDGETGLLVPPSRPRRLAEAMERVVATETGDRFGERGLERVREHYSIERTAAEYHRLYREVAGGEPPSDHADRFTRDWTGAPPGTRSGAEDCGEFETRVVTDRE